MEFDIKQSYFSERKAYSLYSWHKSTFILLQKHKYFNYISVSARNIYDVLIE